MAGANRKSSLIVGLLMTACTAAGTVTVPPVSSVVTQLNAYTIGDLETAKTLANATGDGNAAACWTFLDTLIPTIQPPAEIGVATGIELARLAQLPAFAKACGPLGALTGLPAAFKLP